MGKWFELTSYFQYYFHMKCVTESKENKYFFMEVKGFDLLEVLEKSPKIECQVKFLPTGKQSAAKQSGILDGKLIRAPPFSEARY